MGKLKLDANLWNKIHNKAYNAKSDSSKKDFMKYMKKLYHKIPCPDCKGHMKSFMKNEDIKNYYYMSDNNGEPNGMFMWSWKLHNDVNSRIAKRIVTYDEAINSYKNNINYRPCCSY
jgi:hypothetical protein